MRGRATRWLVGGVAGAVLAACSVNEEPPLPGERIAVLSADSAIEPDSRIADLAIELPRPVRLDAWPQQGGLAHHAMQHVSLADVPVQAWEASAG